MTDWFTERYVDLVQNFVDEKCVNMDQSFLTRTPEAALINTLTFFTEDNDAFEQCQDIIEFLINARRYHFAYLDSKELWGFVEQYTKLDLSKTEEIPGPFGILVNIAGVRKNLGFDINIFTKEDVIKQDRPVSKMFDGVLQSGDSDLLHVLYIDGEKSQQHRIGFQVMISQPYLDLDGESEVEDNSLHLNALFMINSADENILDESYFDTRSRAINYILNANYTTLKLALDSISNDHPEKFHHDMFDFLVNVQRGQNLALNNKENYLKQFDINTNHKGIMVNYSVTRKNETPLMLLVDENIVKSVIEELDAKGEDSSQWQTNLEILYKIPEDKIGMLHYDDEFSKEHDFPFDLTLLI